MSAAALKASSASSALARAVAGGAELEKHLGALGQLLDAQLERGLQPVGRLVEGERGAGRPPGPDVVFDPAGSPAERRRRGEVVCEVRQSAAGTTLGALERLTDAQVQLGASQPAGPVVERAPNELVREPIGQRAGGELLDHSAATSLVEGREELGLAQAGCPADRVELEFRPRRRCELE